MAMPLDYSRRFPSRPFAAVQPIIDATNPMGAIRQIMDFMSRNAQFSVGVPDTSFFPFSAICKLQLTFPGASGGGTGFYIAPDLILSCGHNFLHAVHGRATALTVRPGQSDATTWLDSFAVAPADWSVHPNWEASNASDWGFDLSVIRVNRPPPNGQYFELINYSPAADEPIAVCGYSSSDVDGARQHLDIDKVRQLSGNGEMVDYNLQTRPGASGSPIFAHYGSHSDGSAAPASIPVMGVHTKPAGSTLNKGVLLNPDKIDWIRGRGISSVSTFSLSQASQRAMLGGLPLRGTSRSLLGGLPLQPGGGIARAQSHGRAMGYARPLDRAWIVIDQSAAGGMSVARRTWGHPGHDISGKTTLSVRVPNLPDGGAIRWNIPDATDQTRAVFETSGNATANSTGGTSVTLRAMAPGPLAVDCMVKDASGTTVESNKYWLSSPQFVLVAIHPTTDAFFDGIGMGSRKPAILAEMKATMKRLYRNVNIRFVFPGEALPGHLGLASNPDFPGGVEALPSVYYAETIGADSVMDPEASNDEGRPTPYGAREHGRNHQPGDMAAPMHRHALARGLIHHFAETRAEIAHIQTEAAAGRLSGGDMDLAARMYGRLMGETLSHEIGHYLASSFVEHTGGGLMEGGGGRTTRERTGMTVQTSAPLLTDHGRDTINDLPADVLHAFEDFLPVNPPTDQAGVNARGRVGSFSMSRGGAGGWTNGPARSAGYARPLEGETIHLPGATVLEGWQARAFVIALETAFQAAMSANPGHALIARFVNIGTILDGCDRYHKTLAVGLSGAWGIGAGGGGGAGIVFAPGRRIGFYGNYEGIVGSIYSLGASIQLTLINGGPELMNGTGYMAGISVGTIGWFDAGLLDAPIAVHAVFDGDRNHIGYSFEFGISSGIPVISLIEAYGQASNTATSFGKLRPPPPRVRSLSAVSDEAFEAALQEAIAAGASPDQARAFLKPLFG